MKASAPFCHCGCGRKCFPADVRRGYAAALELPCGTIYLARKVACAQKFLKRRPDLQGELRDYYAGAGKFHGKGSGLWKRALHASQKPPDRQPLTLFDFADDRGLIGLSPRQ